MISTDQPISFFRLHRRMIGLLIYVIGLILAFSFNGLAALANVNGTGLWGTTSDLTTFDGSKPTQADLTSIHCPIFLAHGETGTLSATFRNAHSVPADILVKAVVSEGSFIDYRLVTDEFTIQPGETQNYYWQVTPQDVVGGSFILSRVYLLTQKNKITFPSRTNSCGIFVLNFWKLPGITFGLLLAVISLVCLVSGSVLLFGQIKLVSNPVARLDSGLAVLAGVLMLAMVANFFNRWIVAGLLLILAILLAVMLLSEWLLHN